MVCPKAPISMNTLGLVPVTENDNHYIYSLLKKLKNNDEGFLEELPQKTEHRELGFVLINGNWYFNGYGDDYEDFYDDDQGFTIVPIVGKPARKNPSMLATHIKEYNEEIDNRFIINKSENAIELLSLIENMDDYGDNDFEQWQKAFEYLQNEKFIYGLAKGADKIRKKDLVEITFLKFRNPGSF